MKQILVIEDDQNIAMIVTLRLQKEGYLVINAYEGMEGLELARKNKPDLIILDYMLPKMDGMKVARFLKFDEQTNHIPIIMQTSRAGYEDKEMSHDVKIDRFLTKPVNFSELLLAIKELI